MGRRTFEMVDLIEIYVHWFAGRSKSEIAAKGAQIINTLI
jgi:hypothetical protein